MQPHTRRKFRSNRQRDISFGVLFRSKLRVENWPAAMPTKRAFVIVVNFGSKFQKKSLLIDTTNLSLSFES